MLKDRDEQVDPQLVKLASDVLSTEWVLLQQVRGEMFAARNARRTAPPKAGIVGASTLAAGTLPNGRHKRRRSASHTQKARKATPKCTRDAAIPHRRRASHGCAPPRQAAGVLPILHQCILPGAVRLARRRVAVRLRAAWVARRAPGPLREIPRLRAQIRHAHIAAQSAPQQRARLSLIHWHYRITSDASYHLPVTRVPYALLSVLQDLLALYQRFGPAVRIAWSCFTISCQLMRPGLMRCYGLLRRWTCWCAV